MIARLWQGKTANADADAYEALLRKQVLPGIKRVEGYRGAYLLRRDVEGGVEFVTITLFDSMEAVRGFAGDDVATAVILPEAERLLAEADATARHFEVVASPD